MKLSFHQINSNYLPKTLTLRLLFFDGGNISSPPIKPPDGILWRSISVNILYVEDEIDPNIGLTFLMMDGVNPFIRMPQRMCLEILDECDLTKIINSLSACEELRRFYFCVVVTQSMFSQIMGSLLLMPVLVLKFHGTPRLF